MNHFGIHTRCELVDAGIPPSTVTSRYRRVLPRVYATSEPTTLALRCAVTKWQSAAVLSQQRIRGVGETPRPQRNCGWPRCARVVVEVDGREFHSEPEVFRSDRKRQNWLVRQGWLVLRYAAYDVLADPDAIADDIVTVVRQRRRSRRAPA